MDSSIYKGGCVVHGCTCIKEFKRRPSLIGLQINGAEIFTILIFRKPDKMSGQINVSLTLFSHRNF